MLVQMIYASRPTQPFKAAALNAILTTARAHNPQHGLTGMLLYDHHFYMQVLEGERHQVNALLNCLVKDPRHSNFMLLRFATIQERMYPQWDMGYAPAMALSQIADHPQGVSDDFNPSAMTEKSAESLFARLAAVQIAQYALGN